MAGRQFDAQNRKPPAWMKALEDQKPRCFSQQAWSDYLTEAHREIKDEPDALRAMQRGQLPNYCEDCAGGAWRRSMEKAGKCIPIVSEQIELAIEEPQPTPTR